MLVIVLDSGVAASERIWLFLLQHTSSLQIESYVVSTQISKRQKRYILLYVCIYTHTWFWVGKSKQ